MKLDNFTTARCKKCGWIKQFQPGKEYDPGEFECECVDTPEEQQEPTRLDKLKNVAERIGISFAHNISEATLEKKIKEVQDARQSRQTTQAD